MILKLVRVRGRSLEPLLMDGDVILAVGLRFLLRALKPGDLVVFRHDVYGQLVKQVERISPDRQQVFVAGTRPTSLDSAEFGPIPRAQISGKVVRRWTHSKSTRQPFHTEGRK